MLALLTSVLEKRTTVLQDLVDWAIPDRAYVSSRLLADCRGIGTIKSFSDAKGYGFVDCPAVKASFDCDVFLHHAQRQHFEVGHEVSFALLLNDDRKPQAFDLAPAKDGVDLRGKAWGHHSNAMGPWSGKGKGAGHAWNSGGNRWEKGKATGKGWAGKLKDGVKGFGKATAGEAASARGGGTPGAAMAAYGRKLQAGSGQSPGGAQAASAPAKRPSAMGTWASPKKVNTPASEAAGGEENGERYEGTIKSFNASTGFGFIACDETFAMYGNDVFLHHTQIAGFAVGDVVSFSVRINNQNKPQASSLSGSLPPSKRQKA